MQATADIKYLAQREYCKKNKLPMFTPANGRCYRCGQNVFAEDGGYTEEYANNHLVTGCPFCNYSFCD